MNNQTNINKIISEFNNSSSPNILVAAHRGDWKHAPENSLLGIMNCINMGVDIVEVDIQQTKDKHFVLMHDETIERTTNGNGKVSDHTLHELKKLYLKKNEGGPSAELTTEKIPSLEEVLITVQGKIMINLDVKYGFINEMYSILRKTDTINISIFKGKSDATQVLNDLSEIITDIIYIPIIESDHNDAIIKLTEHFKQYQPKIVEFFLIEGDSIMDQAAYLKNNGSRIWINSMWDSLSFGHGDEKSLKNPNDNWGWIIEKGANIICTNYPFELLQYLKSKGLRNF